jgi:hypothetical protein
MKKSSYKKKYLVSGMDGRIYGNFENALFENLNFSS